MSAGQWYRGKYRVYGEGSVSHWEGCEEEPKKHWHPQISREDWPSRRAWYTAAFFRFMLDHLPRWYMRRVFGRAKREHGDRFPVSVLGWYGKLFNAAHPRVPTVWAPLRIEDSVYDREVLA